MTEPERRTLRAAIDQARREQVEASEPAHRQLQLFLDERLAGRACLLCGAPLYAQRSTRRFCRPAHRANWAKRRLRVAA